MLLFVGICKNASSSLWSCIHGKYGEYKTSHGQHDALYKRQDDIKRANKIICVTRHPYSRWISMYTYLQYQPKWRNMNVDHLLDRILMAKKSDKLDPIGIGRTDLDIVFCPQWTWLGKTVEDAKRVLSRNKMVILNFHQMDRDIRTKVPELKNKIKRHNVTSTERRNSYRQMTPHHKKMIQTIFKEDFELFGWDRSWNPNSNNVPKNTLY